MSTLLLAASLDGLREREEAVLGVCPSSSLSWVLWSGPVCVGGASEDMCGWGQRGEQEDGVCDQAVRVPEAARAAAAA